MTDLKSKNKNMERYFSGQDLYGDDFGDKEIAKWWKEEESGYYDLARNYYRQPRYEYHALNISHGYRHLAQMRFRLCLAMGCADGSDVLPIAPQVERFIAVEPAEQWWSERIGSTPARYIKPRIDGSLPLQNGEADLAVSLSVLHHIPNVSFVISEIGRVLSPGGLFILREPITTLGDWREPRPGLTKNERGLPLPWLEAVLKENHLTPLRRSLCMFPGVEYVANQLGVRYAYGSNFWIRPDAILSQLFRWNARYYRPHAIDKIAPRCAFYVIQKAMI